MVWLNDDHMSKGGKGYENSRLYGFKNPSGNPG